MRWLFSCLGRSSAPSRNSRTASSNAGSPDHAAVLSGTANQRGVPEAPGAVGASIPREGEVRAPYAHVDALTQGAAVHAGVAAAARDAHAPIAAAPRGDGAQADGPAATSSVNAAVPRDAVPAHQVALGSALYSSARDQPERSPHAAPIRGDGARVRSTAEAEHAFDAAMDTGALSQRPPSPTGGSFARGSDSSIDSAGSEGVLGGSPLLTRMLRGRASLDALMTFR